MFSFPITKRELSFWTIPEWRAFVDRPYFRRLWIIQEIALAKSIEVHCGNDTMEWSNLVDTHLGYDSATSSTKNAQLIPNHWRRPTDGQVALLNVLRRAAADDTMRRPTTISDLVFETRHAECEDPRDRLYALLSMESQQVGRDFIMPDYRISISRLFVDVYRKRVLHGKGTYRDVLKLTEGLKLTRQKAVEIWHLLDGRRERALFAGSYFMYRFRMAVVPASYEVTYH